MQPDTTIEKPKNPERRSLYFVAVRSAAYVTACLLGVRLGISQIWDRFYEDFKSFPALDPVRQNRSDKRAALSQEACETAMDSKTVLKRYRAIEDEYGHEANEVFLKNLGIESEGAVGVVKGTWQRFHSLGLYQRHKIAFATVASTVAAATGLALVEYLVTHPSDTHADRVKASAANADDVQR